MKNKIETGLLLDYYGGMLTERQQEILRAYCDMDLSLAELADEYDITRQAAQEMISRTDEKLHDFENKLGLVKKIRNITLALDEIIRSITDSEIIDQLTVLQNQIKEI